MGLGRARGVALLITTTVFAALATTVAAGGPASAAGRAAPSVSTRQVSSGLVRVAGRTSSASPRVRVERRAGSGWALLEITRAHHHRYAARVALPAGSTATVRVTSDRRSRTVVVRMPAPAPAPAPTSTPPPAADPATLYDACGARPLKGDGTPWSCVFHDDFDGTELDTTKWVPQTVFATGTADAYACYRDDPSNVRVHDGHLSLTLVRLDTPAPCGEAGLGPTTLQSGMVTTYHLHSWRYGRFEARIRNTATTAAGLHEAFWMWPDDRYSMIDWPTSGEIDISETYSVHPNLSVPFLHYGAELVDKANGGTGSLPGVNTAYDCTANRGDWNTYTLEWTPTTLTILVNGRTCLVNTSGDPAFQKRYIAQFTQGVGATGNELTSLTPVPATMDVDYFRVWN
jgi:hypothetical protein